MTKQARNGLLALGAVVVAIFVAMSVGGDDGYLVKAELDNAGGLRKNSSVKIGGVPAGKVEKLEITERDTAVATLRIDDGAAPIGEGAELNVRPTDLLGERYAEIKVGDIEKPLPSGASIAMDRTDTPVELDDILNMLDASTSQRLGILINEVGVAMAGRGTDFNKLLSQLPPSLKETDKLIAQVRKENGAMRTGIQRADRVTNLVAGKRDEMGDLIRQASETLELVAERRADLGATISNAPGALTQLRSTLAELDAASTQLKPAARNIQASAQPLRETLEALPDFTKEAGPALEKARKVSPSLTRLARGATPTVRRLEPTTRELEKSLVESAPILKHMGRRGWDDVLFLVNNMNLGLRGRDGIGHFIGAKLNIAAEYIDNAVENFANVELDPSVLSPKKSAPKAAPAPKAPEGPSGPKDPLKPVRDKLGEVTGKVKQLPKDVEESVKKAGDDVKEALGGLTGSLGIRKREETPPSGESDALRLFDYLMGQ